MLPPHPPTFDIQVLVYRMDLISYIHTPNPGRNAAQNVTDEECNPRAFYHIQQ